MNRLHFSSAPYFPVAMLIAGLSMLLLPLSSSAEIYKWVDANGQTHFSQNKEDAGKADVKQVKIMSGTSPTGTAAPQNWQDREIEFRKRQMQKRSAPSQRNATHQQNASGEADFRSDSDAGRCSLARQVISGGVVHGNGAKTDSNDIEVAERDIKTYCH